MNYTRIKYILTAFMAVIVVGLWYGMSFTLPVYHYESSDRGMDEIEVPWKGRHFEQVEARFEEYKKSKGDSSIFLCRTGKRNWFSLNLLWDNLTHRRWELPYMEPSAKLNWNSGK